MQISSNDFKIIYDEERKSVDFSGSLRLWDLKEYQKINKFLLDVYSLNMDNLIINFKDLEFLNSAGISMLCKFVIHVKKLKKADLTILANKNVLWQTKSFQNLKLLWNKIKIQYH